MKIVADSYSVFSYDDGDITVELVGYNEVHTAGSTFAEVGGNTVTISGSGILNIDCPLGANVTVNSGYIESTVADDDLVNGFALTMNGGYVNAQSAAIGSLTMSKGYLDIGSITGNANVEGGYLKAGSVTANSTMSIQNCVVDIAGGVDGTVTFEESNCVFIYDNLRSSTASIVKEVLIKSGMQITQTDFSQAEAAPRIARK